MDNDQLAALLQREFESFRAEMATREELKATEGNILRAIEGLGVQLSQNAAQWSTHFERLSDHVHDLAGQLTKLEAACNAPP